MIILHNTVRWVLTTLENLENLENSGTFLILETQGILNLLREFL